MPLYKKAKTLKEAFTSPAVQMGENIFKKTLKKRPPAPPMKRAKTGDDKRKAKSTDLKRRTITYTRKK
jgi:hypothetical protein